MDNFYKDAKILVVDDVEEVLKSTKNCLTFEGMNVECMSNPIEALEYIKNNEVDVLLLDFFMPEINGDEFVKRLRQFNNETIIILRTGYSDQVPPMQVIDNLNVQGYIDKLKGDDELIVMTKAAIKTSYLTKTLKEKNENIEFLNYKSTAIGNLITNLLNEAESQIFSISGAVNMLQDEDVDEDIVRIISRANGNIESLFNALKFSSQSNITVRGFEKTVLELLKAKSKIDGIQVKITTDNEEMVIPGSIEVLVLAALEIYYYFKSINATELNMNLIKEDGQIVLTVVDNQNYSEDFIRNLKKLVKRNPILELKNDNFLKISIKI